MGKQRRERHKLHLPSQKSKKTDEELDNSMDTLLPLTPPKDNLFSDIKIDFSSINKTIPDDVQSIKSFKSVKSEAGGNKILPKKEKLRLRRERLMKKIDTVTQLKKELKLRKKRENTSIIGNTNPLHDALPSLESLLKSRPNINFKSKEPPKKKAIDKASKRKKNLIHGIDMIKQTLRDKRFNNNPLDAISNHIKAVVDYERSNLISKKK